MASVKEAVLSAHIAFAPRGPWIAAGTVAGAIDVSFSTSSKLEIYDTDLATRGSGLQLTGSTEASDRFCSLAWGSLGLDTGALPYGILAGGLSDGTIAVWNPADILSSPPSNGNLSPSASAPPLAALQNHSAAVRGLEFNSLSPNLLASGAGGGELLIWDMSDPGQPNLYPAMRSERGHDNRAGIAALAWNTKVQHILATASADGAFSVWDLRRQKPTMDNVSDTSGRLRKASAIAWNPAMSVQVVIASGDDRCPTLQLWDLRNQHAPVHELLGHDRGILAVAWSQHDPSILVSTGHDRRTILWDMPEGDMRGELPLHPGPGFDIRWSPSSPGLLATAALGAEMGGQDGQVSLHTLATFSPANSQSADGNLAVPQTLKQAPAWMKRPVGAVFGFGGALARFSNVLRPEEGHKSPLVSVHQVVTEEGLVEASTQFEQALGGGDHESLRGLCESKAASLPGEEGETWAFLRIHFDPDPRRHLLTSLGFAHALETGDQGPLADVASAAAALEALDLTSNRTPRPTAGSPVVGFNDADADAFFEDLQPSTPAPPTPKSAREAGGSPQHPHHTHHPAEPESGTSENEIQRAMYVANYAGAVDLCLQAGRMADALLIASLGGTDLWNRAQTAFMARAPRPYMKIVAAVQKADMTGLIKSRPLDDWKDTLAILCSFSTGEEWPGLCDTLAKRLAAAGLRHAATLCWICAGNVDNTVRHWLSEGNARSMEELQSLMERAVTLGLGVNQQTASSALGDLIVSYASTLAAQGCMGTAWEYLERLPGEASAPVAELRDRVFRSLRPGAALDAQSPPFPFVAEEVVASPALLQQQYDSAQQYNQQQQYYDHNAAYNAASYQQPQGGYQQPQGGYQQGQGGYQQPQPAYQAPYQQPAQQSYNQPQQHNYNYSSNGNYQSAPANRGYGQQAAGYGGAGGGYGQQQQQQHTPYGSNADAGGYGGYGGPPVAKPAQQAPPPAQQKPAWEPPKPAPAPTKPTWGQAQPQAPQQQHPPAPAPTPAQSIYAPHQAQQPPEAARPAPFVPQAAPAGAPRPLQVNTTPVFEPRRASGTGGAARTGSTPGQFATYGQSQPSHAPPQQAPTSPYGQAGSPYGGAGGPAPPGPGVNAPAPPAPAPVQPPPPPAPSGPPANVTISNVDTSKVPQAMRPVVASLSSLYNACAAAVAGQPSRKREMDNNAQRLGVLFWHLNAGSLSPGVADALRQICAALDARDYNTASTLQANLTTTDWDECATWLTAIKRLVKMRSQLP